ncbi:Butyrate--acetoacetate CoA-transferase subunit B (EC [Olavius sp. associated proteobacterium Delta 1]|nr:Butyrate--acetoacetate CoA-transferase subunit B (EC [Olavius sp. associated proteobacterium Delta 1]
MSYKEKIAKRAAAEIQEGQIINLGIGIPTLIPKYLAGKKQVIVHSENGILGMGNPRKRGSEDRNLIDAGGTYVTIETGGCYFDSVLSFSLVRGGRLDLAVIGALQVSAAGDLANWIIPGKYAPGIGGGMELAQKARRLIITTTHTTREGKPKILQSCDLPLTAKGCVNTIITELAVMDVVEGGVLLREIAEETELETVMAKTGATVMIPQGDLPRF